MACKERLSKQEAYTRPGWTTETPPPVHIRKFNTGKEEEIVMQGGKIVWPALRRMYENEISGEMSPPILPGDPRYVYATPKRTGEEKFRNLLLLGYERSSPGMQQMEYGYYDPFATNDWLLVKPSYQTQGPSAAGYVQQGVPVLVDERRQLMVPSPGNVAPGFSRPIPTRALPETQLDEAETGGNQPNVVKRKGILALRSRAELVHLERMAKAKQMKPSWFFIKDKQPIKERDCQICDEIPPKRNKSAQIVSAVAGSSKRDAAKGGPAKGAGFGCALPRFGLPPPTRRVIPGEKVIPAVNCRKLRKVTVAPKVGFGSTIPRFAETNRFPGRDCQCFPMNPNSRCCQACRR